jgi:hypothetical protein
MGYDENGKVEDEEEEKKMCLKMKDRGRVSE